VFKSRLRLFSIFIHPRKMKKKARDYSRFQKIRDAPGARSGALRSGDFFGVGFGSGDSVSSGTATAPGVLRQKFGKNSVISDLQKYIEGDTSVNSWIPAGTWPG
jgi:hypothetical protein